MPQLSQIKFRENKFAIIWKICDLFEKLKKIDFKFKNFRIVELGIDFVSDFQKVPTIFQKTANLFNLEVHLSKLSANSENYFYLNSVAHYDRRSHTS